MKAVDFVLDSCEKPRIHKLLECPYHCGFADIKRVNNLLIRAIKNILFIAMLEEILDNFNLFPPDKDRNRVKQEVFRGEVARLYLGEQGALHILEQFLHFNGL